MSSADSKVSMTVTSLSGPAWITRRGKAELPGAVIRWATVIGSATVRPADGDHDGIGMGLVQLVEHIVNRQ